MPRPATASPPGRPKKPGAFAWLMAALCLLLLAGLCLLALGILHGPASRFYLPLEQHRALAAARPPALG